MEGACFFTARRAFCIGNIIHQTNSIKFLGIHIDEKLNFKNHIEHISSKTSKNVGLIYRLSKFLPIHILKYLYHSLVMPHILYGIELWYGASATDRNRIFIIQKKTIRAINSLPFNSHTNMYFKNMKLLKVEDIYNRNVLLHIAEKISRNELIFSLDIHEHNTRGRNSLNIPRCNLSHTLLSWKYRGQMLWNSLPERIKT